QPRRKEACARSSCQEIHTPAPGVFRFDRAATITGGDRSICEGQSPESLGGISRSLAGLATIRGTLGAALARRGAVCRYRRVRARLAVSESMALPGLCD